MPHGWFSAVLSTHTPVRDRLLTEVNSSIALPLITGNFNIYIEPTKETQKDESIFQIIYLHIYICLYAR